MKNVRRLFDLLMLGLGLAALALALHGCAIPVRPIAKVAPTRDGSLHFVPDPEQEPQIPGAVISGAAGILSTVGGPWGALAASVITGLGSAAAVNRHHKKKASNKAKPE